jgi:hypothetical protein
MTDRIEEAQERVGECRRLIEELLKEYNCRISRGYDGIVLYDEEFEYKEYL